MPTEHQSGLRGRWRMSQTLTDSPGKGRILFQSGSKGPGPRLGCRTQAREHQRRRIRATGSRETQRAGLRMEESCAVQHWDGPTIQVKLPIPRPSAIGEPQNIRAEESLNLPHYAHEDTEAQRSRRPCSRLLSELMTEQDLQPGCLLLVKTAFHTDPPQPIHSQGCL